MPSVLISLPPTRRKMLGTTATLVRKKNAGRFLSFSTRTSSRSASASTSAAAAGKRAGPPHPLNQAPHPSHCDVVQGLSLLRTAVSRPSPSLMLLPGLRSLPFWSQYDADRDETRVAYDDPSIKFAVEHLEGGFPSILEEYRRVSPSLSSDYGVEEVASAGDGDQHGHDSALHSGKWDWHSYMQKGKLQGHFCEHFPTTSEILQALRDEGLLFEGTPFGYVFFSRLYGNSKIAAHTAPMNFRVRVHLPLIVPKPDGQQEEKEEDEEDVPPCGIRVGPLTREWVPGRCLLLDDAYDHEVWNRTPHERVLLLVDLWHPDVTFRERQDVIQLFQHAEEQGWISSSKK